MIDAESWLEDWCEENNIDMDKLPEEIVNRVTSRAEDDAATYLNSKGREFISEWAWLDIEQHLDDHPEWKKDGNAVEGEQNE
jgi:hypothetical protein